MGKATKVLTLIYPRAFFHLVVKTLPVSLLGGQHESGGKAYINRQTNVLTYLCPLEGRVLQLIRNLTHLK